MKCMKCKQPIAKNDLGLEGVTGVLGGVKVELCYHCGVLLYKWINNKECKAYEPGRKE